MKTIIHLEDKGQDFLQLVCNKIGEIKEAKPFQNSVWRGGFIPLDYIKIGRLCPIHHPPYINFGCLKQKLEKVEIIKNDEKF